MHPAPASQPPPRRAWVAALPTLGLLLLSGCIVLPRSAEVYDPQCQTYVKQIVLETEVIGAIGGCRNDGCALMLASMGIVSAASAVISGSVAIIGNVVYWAERKGRCPEPPAGRQAAPAVEPVAPVAPVAPPAPPAPAASGVPLPRPPVVPGIVPGTA